MTQKELENLIKYHQNKYYDSEPEISDAEFDELWDELATDYPNSELLTKVGDATNVDENKFPHRIHMGSQAKINTYEGLSDWIRLKNIEFPVMIEEKIDGLSVELIYHEGKLVQALTRGDGLFGKSIIDNVKCMNVPKEIPFSEADIVVRGEIVLPTENIPKLVGFDEIKNARNIASGIANQKDSKQNLELLTIICYDVVADGTENDKIAFLSMLGFTLPKYVWLANSEDGIIKFIKDIDVLRNTSFFGYQIDGVVIKQNTIPANADKTKARPDWQRAFKYQADIYETWLTGVEWSRNGYNFTPVAILEPVEIDGTTVSRASLANLGEIKRLGIRIPCKVKIAKQNEIIPKVHEVVEQITEGAEFPSPPALCPICGETLAISDTQVQCVNPVCKTRIEHKIAKWIDTIGALGFGDAMIQYMVYGCNITSISELYCNDVVAKVIENAKSSKNAQKAFADLWARSKDIPLYDFIGGFDIEGIGSKTVKLITDNGFNTIDKLRQVNYRELMNIDGFGETRANIFIEQIALIEDEINSVLNTNRVTIKSSGNIKTNDSLIFCITGTLSRPRKDYESLINEKGCKLSSSVTKKTDYLVNNDINSTSSKNENAKKLGIPIISEEEFLNIINTIS